MIIDPGTYWFIGILIIAVVMARGFWFGHYKKKTPSAGEVFWCVLFWPITTPMFLYFLIRRFYLDNFGPKPPEPLIRYGYPPRYLEL